MARTLPRSRPAHQSVLQRVTKTIKRCAGQSDGNQAACLPGPPWPVGAESVPTGYPMNHGALPRRVVKLNNAFDTQYPGWQVTEEALKIHTSDRPIERYACGRVVAAVFIRFGCRKTMVSESH